MKITVLEGDITEAAVDAIVNAANSSLLGGGGVDGAIHKAAGPELLEACREVRQTSYPRGLPAGQAVATTAGALKAKWVIHTVGPNRHQGEADPEVLESCFESSLNAAEDLGATSVAVPAIGGESTAGRPEMSPRRPIPSSSTVGSAGAGSRSPRWSSSSSAIR